MCLCGVCARARVSRPFSLSAFHPQITKHKIPSMTDDSTYVAGRRMFICVRSVLRIKDVDDDFCKGRIRRQLIYSKYARGNIHANK
jgi:hypothetical protein